MFLKFANVQIKGQYSFKDKADFEKKISEILETSDKKVTALIEPNSLYIITAGLHGDEANQNGDYFRWDELLKIKTSGRFAGKHMWETWIGCPALENHNPENIRGEIIDTWPIKAEKSIDMLLKIDERINPNMVKGIRNGSITGTSMGVMVGHSYCSICQNLAYNEDEWCDHLHPRKLNLKGKRYTGQDGNKFPEKVGQMVYEDNRDLEGVEDSIITLGEPADPKALLKQVLASKENEMLTNPRSADVRAGLSNGIVQRTDAPTGPAKNIAVVGEGARGIGKDMIDALYAKRGFSKSATSTSKSNDFNNATEVLAAIKAGSIKKLEAIAYLEKFNLVTAEQLEEITPSMAVEILESQVTAEKEHDQVLAQVSTAPIKNKDIPKEKGAGELALTVNEAKPEETKPAPQGSVDAHGQMPSHSTGGGQAISESDAKPQEDKPAPEGKVNPKEMAPTDPSKQADETNKSKPQEKHPDPVKMGQISTTVKNKDIPSHSTGGGQAVSLNEAKPEETKPAPKGSSNPNSQMPSHSTGGGQAISESDAKPEDSKPKPHKAQLDGLMDGPPAMGGGMEKPPHDAPPMGGGNKAGLSPEIVQTIRRDLELLADVKEVIEDLENIMNKKVKKPKGDGPKPEGLDGGDDKKPPFEKKDDGPKEEKKETPKEEKKEEAPALASKASEGYKVDFIEDAKSPADSYYLVSLNDSPVLQITAKQACFDKTKEDLEAFKAKEYLSELNKVLNAQGCKHVHETVFYKKATVLAQALPDDKFSSNPATPTPPASPDKANAPAKPMVAEPDALQNMGNDAKASNLEGLFIGVFATAIGSGTTNEDEVRQFAQGLANSDTLNTIMGKISKEAEHSKMDSDVGSAPPVTPTPGPADMGGAPSPSPMDSGKMAMVVSKVKEIIPAFKAAIEENAVLKARIAKIDEDATLRARVAKTMEFANQKVKLGLLDAKDAKNEALRLAKLTDEEIDSEIKAIENSVKIARNIKKNPDYTNVEDSKNVKTAATVVNALTSIPSQIDTEVKQKATYQWSVGLKR